MACEKCQSSPVIKLPTSQESLCKSCFIDYFERKVFKTIREYDMLQKKEHIGVAVSGGKDSTTVLHLMHLLVKERRDLKLTAIAIDEGIDNYRDIALDGLQKFCAQKKIDLQIVRFEDVVGKKLDILVGQFPKACSVCGVFRRYFLNKKAREVGITKLVTGHNMDDEAQSVLMNQFRKNMKVSARLGPVTGVVHDPKFIPRIKPLYFMAEKEVATYAFLQGFIDKFVECPYSSDAYRGDVRDMLYAFDAKFPGTKQNILHAFLEILPQLKEKYKSEMHYCKECGEPAAQDICKACQFIEKIIKEKEVNAHAVDQK